MNSFSIRSLGVPLLFFLTVLSGCSSVTIRPDGGEKDHSAPTYLDSKPFYFWGLNGNHRVDVNEVCEGANVSQMQTMVTASDYLMGTVTFFIYSPRTVKVWCQE
ncbi:MAG: Bor family protein [Pseudomonadales bacterium]